MKNQSSHRCPRCHLDLRTLRRNDDEEDPRLRHIRNCVYKTGNFKGGADAEVGTSSESELDDAQKFDNRNIKTDDVIQNVDVDKPSSPSASTSKLNEQDGPPKIFKEKTKIYYGGMATCITFSRDSIETDFSVAFEALKRQLRDHIVLKMKQYNNVKIQLETSILFRRTENEESQGETSQDDGDHDSKLLHHDVIKHLWSSPTVIDLATDVNEALNSIYEELISQIENMTDLGSNFFVKDVISFKLSIYKVNQLSKVGGFVRLPAQLKSRYLMTPINYDNSCLIYCICLHLALADRFPHLNKSLWPKQFSNKTVFNEDELFKICGHIFNAFLSNIQLKLPIMLKKKNLKFLSSHPFLKDFNLTVFAFVENDFFVYLATKKIKSPIKILKR